MSHLSAVIFAALMYVGLSKGKPGPFEAFVAAIVFIGYVVYQATQGHLSPQKDTALAGMVCLIGFGTITWEVLVDGEQVIREDLVTWGGLLIAIVVLAGWTLLARRHE